MSNYVNGGYYYNSFKGEIIPQEKLEKFTARASSIIKDHILNKDITFFENDVKNATCSVAEILYNQYLNKERLKNILNGTEKLVTSEKVGDYSRNVSNILASDLEKFCSDEYIKEQIQSELEIQLMWTGLLYNGFPYV